MEACSDRRLARWWLKAIELTLSGDWRRVKAVVLPGFCADGGICYRNG